MKLVNVKGYKIDVTVLLDWDNIVQQDIKELNLKKGDDLGLHFRNHHDKYTYTPIPYYTKLYHPEEILGHMRKKCPYLDKVIEEFDLVLSV